MVQTAPRTVVCPASSASLDPYKTQPNAVQCQCPESVTAQGLVWDPCAPGLETILPQGVASMAAAVGCLARKCSSIVQTGRCARAKYSRCSELGVAGRVAAVCGCICVDIAAGAVTSADIVMLSSCKLGHRSSSSYSAAFCAITASCKEHTRRHD
jgi:hypothetical protein